MTRILVGSLAGGILIFCAGFWAEQALGSRVGTIAAGIGIIGILIGTLGLLNRGK